MLNQGIVISVQEAESIIAGKICPFSPESVPISNASGRVLVDSLQSDRDLPPFNRSTFDGIALSSKALEKGRREFPIAGIGYAGSPQLALPDSDSCIEIMTGAPLPNTADCVAKIEDIRIESGIAYLPDSLHLKTGYGVHSQGSDSAKGSTVLQKGCRLTAKELSVAASIGQDKLTVSALPRISIVTTGDELVEISNSPRPHQIRRSNDLALEVALKSAGYSQIERRHAADDPEKTESVVNSVLEQSDVVILAGGVSKGKKDYLPDALENAGVAKAFQWVSQRPGKPLWFGDTTSSERPIFVFALPGNPVSCFTCLHRYVLPALNKMSGQRPTPPRFAALASDFSFKPPLTLFLPVTLESDPTGLQVARPLPFNTSGDYVSVARTDGFLELLRKDSEFPQGEAFRYFPWQT